MQNDEEQRCFNDIVLYANNINAAEDGRHAPVTSFFYWCAHWYLVYDEMSIYSSDVEPALSPLGAVALRVPARHTTIRAGCDENMDMYCRHLLCVSAPGMLCPGNAIHLNTQ